MLFPTKKLKKLLLPFFLITSSFLFPIFSLSSCGSSGDTPTPPPPPPQSTFVINQDTILLQDNIMYDELGTLTTTIPNSINLKTISLANNNVKNFELEGEIDNTIFIPSDFTCWLHGSDESKIIVNDENSCSDSTVSGIIVGNDKPSYNGTTPSANIQILNLDISSTSIDSASHNVFFNNSFSSSSSLNLSNSVLFSSSSTFTSEIFFNEAVSGSLNIINNSIFSSDSPVSYNVFFNSSISYRLNILNNVMVSSSNIYFKTILSSSQLTIKNNILSSDSSFKAYGILFNNSVSGTLEIENNILSISSNINSYGISFDADFSGSLTFIDNSITCSSTNASYDIRFYSTISSSATVEFSSNVLSSFSSMSTYGIVFFAAISGSVTSAEDTPNLFYWSGTNGTSFYSTSPSLFPANFFSNGTDGIGEQTTSNSISVESSAYSNLTFILYYADSFNSVSQSGLDVGQIDELADKMTKYLELYSIPLSKEILNLLIEELTDRSPWKSAIEITSETPTTANQIVYNDAGSATVLTLTSCINLATVSGVSNKHYFLITDAVTSTIYVPTSFFAYIKCSSTGSIAPTAYSASTYGIVSGNSDSGQASILKSLTISNCNILPSFTTGSNSSTGIYFAGAITSSVEIFDNIISSTIGIYFPQSVSSFLKISNNIISSSKVSIAAIISPRIYFYNSITSTAQLYIINNILHSYCEDVPTGVYFNGNVAGLVKIMDNTIATRTSSRTTNSYAIYFKQTVSATVEIINNILSALSSSSKAYGIYAETLTGTVTISNNAFYTFAPGTVTVYGIFINNSSATVTCDPSNKNTYYWTGDLGVSTYVTTGPSLPSSTFFSNGTGGAGQKTTFASTTITVPFLVLLYYADKIVSNEQDSGQKTLLRYALYSYLSLYTNPTSEVVLSNLLENL